MSSYQTTTCNMARHLKPTILLSVLVIAALAPVEVTEAAHPFSLRKLKDLLKSVMDMASSQHHHHETGEHPHRHRHRVMPTMAATEERLSELSREELEDLLESELQEVYSKNDTNDTFSGDYPAGNYTNDYDAENSTTGSGYNDTDYYAENSTAGYNDTAEGYNTTTIPPSDGTSTPPEDEGSKSASSTVKSKSPPSRAREEGLFDDMKTSKPPGGILSRGREEEGLFGGVEMTPKREGSKSISPTSRAREEGLFGGVEMTPKREGSKSISPTSRAREEGLFGGVGKDRSRNHYFDVSRKWRKLYYKYGQKVFGTMEKPTEYDEETEETEPASTEPMELELSTTEPREIEEPGTIEALTMEPPATFEPPIPAMTNRFQQEMKETYMYAQRNRPVYNMVQVQTPRTGTTIVYVQLNRNGTSGIDDLWHTSYLMCSSALDYVPSPLILYFVPFIL